MIRARFSPKAARDLDEHCGYIAGDNPEVAERVRQTILTTADFLAQHRELGRRIRKAAPRHAQIRWFVVPNFRNDLIFYQPYRETIMVIRVIHPALDEIAAPLPDSGSISNYAAIFAGTHCSGPTPSFRLFISARDSACACSLLM